MRHIFGILACCISLLLFCCCGSNDYDIYGSISGQVIDSKTGESLSVVSVMLVNEGTTRMTGQDGRFIFENLHSGKYTISLEKDGWLPNRKDVTIKAGERLTDIAIPMTQIPQ